MEVIFLLDIIQTYVSNEDSEELERLEKANHTNSTEYLPFAKEKTYSELANKEPISFLAVKLTAFDGEPTEKFIIDTQNTQSYMRIFSKVTQVISSFDNLTVLSISYNAYNNRSKDEGMTINALVQTADKQPIPGQIISEIIEKISTDLQFKQKGKVHVDKDGHPEKFFAKYTPDNDARTLNEQMESHISVVDENFYDDNLAEKDTPLRENGSENFFKSFRDEDDDILDLSEENTNPKGETASNENKTGHPQPNKNPYPAEKSSQDSYAGQEINLTQRPAFGYTEDASNINKTEKNLKETRSFSSESNPEHTQFIPKPSKNIISNSQSKKPVVKNPVSKENNTMESYEDVYHTGTYKPKRGPVSNFQPNKANPDTVNKPARELQMAKSVQEKPQEQSKDKFDVKNIAKKIIEKEKLPETLNDNPEKMARPYTPYEPDKNSSYKEDKEPEQTNRPKKVFIDKEHRETPDKFSFAENTGGEFIHSIFDGKYGNNEAQDEAYINSNKEHPFLNEIDDYIPEFDINELEAPDPVYDIHEADEFIKTTSSKQKIKKEFDTVMTYFMENEATSVKRVLSGDVDVDYFMQNVKMYLDKYSRIPEEDRAMFEEKIKNAFFSYYVLTPAIFDPDISDIRVLAPDNINVKVKGKHYTASNLKFINESDFYRFINGLIIKNKIHVDSPILVFTDKSFNDEYILRFNLCLGAINSSEAPYLHIRKVPKDKMTLEKLIGAGMLTPKIAKYLLEKVATSRGLVFSGPSASGKTTLMNALVDYIPKDKSILCIQESEEMFSNVHPNAYFQHMLKDVYGNIVVGLSELGKNGLLCDSGYFIIGECKGSEVRDLLRASNTGHKCWCSVHAQSSMETIPRLADYVKYGSDYSFKEAVRMLKDLEVIVYIENFKIKEITEIAGYDEDNERIIYRPVYINPEFAR